MTDSIVLAVCRHFLPEIRAVVDREGWKQVIPVELPATCGRPALTIDALLGHLAPVLADCRAVHVFGSACLQALTGPGCAEILPAGARIVLHRFEQCFSLVTCPSLVRLLQREGGYLLTPGWLAEWPERLRRDGFDQATAREFFRESIRRLVFLDTGTEPKGRERFAAFCEYLELPGRIEEIGLDHLTLQLKALLADDLRTLERNACEEALRESRKRASETMMMGGVLGRLAQTRNSSEIVNHLFSFCRMLFSPRTMAFLELSEGRFQHLSTVPPLGSDDAGEQVRERLGTYERPYGRTASGEGFFLRVSFSGDILGVLELEGFAHPEYLDRYLELSLRMNPVVGLALANARAYARLVGQLEEIRTLRDEAEKANRAKSEFLASTSHELRNSMNGIVGMSEILALTPLGDEQREYLECIDASGQNLLSLVNDVIDLSKIEAGRIQLETIEFGLRALLQEILRSQNTVLLHKRLFARMEIAPEVPDRLIGDPLRLKQVLLNLLSNAVKFTEKGTIVLAVGIESPAPSTVPGAETLSRLRFTVTDSGIGIRPDALEKLFSPFQQADSTISRRFGGTGLGLAICRKLTQLMNGTIWAESREGQGSSFFCVLPFITVVGPAIPATRPAPGLSWDGPPLHLLLVEDDPVSQKVQVAILYKFGHAVELAENGVQALQMLDGTPYDLILMDVLMPGLDGIETLHRLRAAEGAAGSKTPVIAVTAQAFEVDRDRLLNEGFDGYVAKPVRAAHLAAEMKRCLKRTVS